MFVDNTSGLIEAITPQGYGVVQFHTNERLPVETVPLLSHQVETVLVFCPLRVVQVQAVGFTERAVMNQVSQQLLSTTVVVSVSED